MILRDGLMIGAMHHLYIGGCDAVTLAEEYGTPLYVMDEQYIRGMCKAFTGSMNAYAPEGMICYASKAFSTMAMCKIIAQEGMGLDVVSGGELYTALKAGFPMDKVTLHGNCKTPGEMRMAVDLGVGRIVIDNRNELPILQNIAASLDKKVNVLLRLNPGIDAGAHHAVKTAVADCKFGVGIDDGEAMSVIHHIMSCKNLNLTGVHVHLGSQIFEMQPYLDAINRMTDFMLLASAAVGHELDELIIGGGFGVRYTEADPPTVNPREAVRVIGQELDRQAKAKGMKVPKLILEPGRILVAEAGLMLYTVTSVKEIPDVRTYVGIDGGMMDNPRVALYDGKYEAVLANRADEASAGAFAIAGRACEQGDVMGYDFRLPQPEVGDILAMPVAGAYQYSMASNYNRVPVPAVVMTRYGKSSVIVERQRYEDIVQYDRIPTWLELRG